MLVRFGDCHREPNEKALGQMAHTSPRLHRTVPQCHKTKHDCDKPLSTVHRFRAFADGSDVNGEPEGNIPARDFRGLVSLHAIFSSVRRSIFQKFSDFLCDFLGESKPNRRMTKTMLRC